MLSEETKSFSANHISELQKMVPIDQPQISPAMRKNNQGTSGIKTAFFFRKHFHTDKQNFDKASLRVCPQLVALQHRTKQTRILLVKFTIITLVFIFCNLPHQVLWLLIDFKHIGNEFFSQKTLNFAHLVTYTNCVINPLLYGQYNKKFRRNIQRNCQNLKKFIQ